ncbi:MAG TPA: DUF465 domain-containing protein [Micavibrio sp.]|nr:YdcH family protein [Pseudomonadota bacterium]MEC8663916.1 YdcH family protein [Pseudomonadota bacterium]HIF24710.1 DUF465 domain-containing protein [Micavibrio sp.]HIL28245.1 DUF465 domain-containing protein [Micavibrio sp.]
MQNTREASRTENAYLESLLAKHEAISGRIDQELKHPAIQESLVKRLKLEKLKIKEQIVHLEGRLN